MVDINNKSMKELKSGHRYLITSLSTPDMGWCGLQEIMVEVVTEHAVKIHFIKKGYSTWYLKDCKHNKIGILEDITEL